MRLIDAETNPLDKVSADLPSELVSASIGLSWPKYTPSHEDLMEKLITPKIEASQQLLF